MTSVEKTPIVVQKYGGSSVADAARLGLVADRVAHTKRAGANVVVVVSAMGKTTDQLLELAKTVSASPARRELDMLVSTGERISMALLAMALHERGLDAISFTGSQSGILTNDRHSGARIIEVRPIRIEDELARGRVVIVAGFQGMSYRREITTLGRGGSDTTAVALAAALGADCEIYSDVDGVYSADPRVVPQARRIDQIGYDEMQELSEHGAKVLNAHAVEWAKRAGIVIFARATSGQGQETRVTGAPSRSGAVAVTGCKALVKVSGGPHALAILARHEVALRRVSRETLRLVRDDVPDWATVEAELRADGAIVEVEGAVTVVGRETGSNARFVEQILAMAEAQEYDASPLQLTLYVAPDRVDDLVRKIHALLV